MTVMADVPEPKAAMTAGESLPNCSVVAASEDAGSLYAGGLADAGGESDGAEGVDGPLSGPDAEADACALDICTDSAGTEVRSTPDPGDADVAVSSAVLVGVALA